MRRTGLIVLLGLLAGCGTPEIVATPIPTLAPILKPESGALRMTPLSTSTPATSASLPTPAEDPAGSQLDQYRRWIDEARATHPYSETAALMWDVMLCESSGAAEVEGPGGLIGLFQYTPQTWESDWNPYRDQPISDARAQIFATAKAWSDGNQQWWQVCFPP